MVKDCEIPSHPWAFVKSMASWVQIGKRLRNQNKIHMEKTTISHQLLVKNSTKSHHFVLCTWNYHNPEEYVSYNIFGEKTAWNFSTENSVEYIE